MVTKHRYICRSGRAGSSDLSARVPELSHMAQKTVSLFGLGAIGAPIALELARAGVGTLRILDHDYVDPATAVRWPFGFSEAGHQKTECLARFIRANYPLTEVVVEDHFLGAVVQRERRRDSEVVAAMVDGASLIIDATAEVGIQTYLSIISEDASVPYMSVDATPGAWGGSICRIDPDNTGGCWNCFRSCLYADDPPLIPLPPMNPSGDVQPVGCAEPTFTGSSFDLGMISMQAVRMAVSTLSPSFGGGYPYCGYDAVIISLRTEAEKFALPVFDGYILDKHPDCHRCSI